MERQTTEAIEEDRRIADENRARDRAAHDRHVTEGQERTRQGEESVVMAERERADQATDKERALQDASLRRERREKQLVVEALLSIERQRTDSNLSHERTGIDLAYQDALRNLAEEQARHMNTRQEPSDRELSQGMIVTTSRTNPLPSRSALKCYADSFCGRLWSEPISSDRSRP